MTQDVIFDFARRERIGFDEAVFSSGKSAEQLAETIQIAIEKQKSLFLTRLDSQQYASLPETLRMRLDYDPVSRTAILDKKDQTLSSEPIAIVCAGTSDIPVAREVERTLAFNGIAGRRFYDVGVAGLWRLGAQLDDLRACPVIIVIAGMDGALTSVIGGLLGGLIIALPTSTGYGMSNEGQTALNAALASCAPGIVAVNIDNGYGAAIAALRAWRIRGNTPQPR